ncbi:MAG: YdaS family helix-turn-helix protein [Prosthecobacter sp.]|nr:YdaS family helix-turn-helix protein [Prosthecobacter sp.]
MDINTYLITARRTGKNFADALGVPPPLLSQWRTGVRAVPAERCPSVERETGGLVTCEELRPDVDWAYLRGTAARPEVAA